MIYLFFSQSKNQFQKFLKKSYSHARAVVDDGQHLILIEPLYASLSIRVIENAKITLIESLAEKWEAVEVLAYQDKPDFLARNIKMRVSFFTCVGFIKYLLGINNFLILTPWQLSKYLKKGKIVQLYQKEV